MIDIYLQSSVVKRPADVKNATGNTYAVFANYLSCARLHRARRAFVCELGFKRWLWKERILRSSQLRIMVGMGNPYAAGAVRRRRSSSTQDSPSLYTKRPGLTKLLPQSTESGLTSWCLQPRLVRNVHQTRGRCPDLPFRLMPADRETCPTVARQQLAMWVRLPSTPPFSPPGIAAGSGRLDTQRASSKMAACTCVEGTPSRTWNLRLHCRRWTGLSYSCTASA